MSLLQFLLVTFQASLTTFGGGVAFIPILAAAYVPLSISVHDYYTIVAYASSTPGPIAPFITSYVAYINYGPVGAFLGIIVLILPTTLLVIYLYPLYQKHKDHPLMQKINTYIRPFLFIMFISLILTQIRIISPSLIKYWWQLIVIVLINFIGLKVLKKVPIIITVVTVIIFAIMTM